MSWSERQDRRQRATEAFWDDFGGPHLSAANTHSGHALEQAIHAATRVRITPEMVKAALQACENLPYFADESDVRPILATAFEAAGFEVEP